MDAVGGGDSVGSGPRVVTIRSGDTGSSYTVSGGSVGLGSSHGVLVSGKGSPVNVLVDVTVSISSLTDSFSVVLVGGFSGTGLAFTNGTGVVLSDDRGVDGSGLCVTRVHTIYQWCNYAGGGIAEDGDESDLQTKQSVLNGYYFSAYS